MADYRLFKDQHILCVGPDAWQHTDAGRTLEAMRRLAGRNRILYVESFSSGAPAPIRKRVFSDLRSAYAGRGVERLVADVPGLYRFSPSYARNSSAAEDQSPDPALLFDVALACDVVSVRPNLLWLADPRTSSLRRWLTGIPTVYQVEDTLSRRPHAPDCEAVAKAEDELLASADAVLCGSRPLHLRLRDRVGPRAHYLPHGIDYAAYGRPASPPSPLADIARPIAGFCGLLTRHHDTDLLAECARQAPDISFVVAGSPRQHFAGLRQLANLHWLNPVARDAWPALLQSFDVCLLPLRAGSWMASACPPQLFPYLASGRPIVSSPLPQVLWLVGPHVSLASRPPEFLEAVRWELANDTPDRIVHRRAIAAEHDWSCYSQRLAAALDGVAGKPGVDPLACFRRYFSGVLEHAGKTLSPTEHFWELLRLGATRDIVERVLRMGTGVSDTVEQ